MASPDDKGSPWSCYELPAQPGLAAQVRRLSCVCLAGTHAHPGSILVLVRVIRVELVVLLTLGDDECEKVENLLW